MTERRGPARAFQLWTQDGSTFIVRFDPQLTDGTTEYGQVTVLGRSVRLGQEVQLKGLAALPEVGGRITVSAVPEETAVIAGEAVPIYPAETISQVVELQVPGQ